MKKSFFAALALACTVLAAHAEWIFDAEIGPAYTDSNDVAIPGDSGTRFSLADDFNQDKAVAFRFRVSYLLNERHVFSFLAAPLVTYADTSSLKKNVDFNGLAFAAGSDVETTYRFDTYRFTYRYNFLSSREFELGLGLTGLIRDASITLKGGSGETTKSNLGFVPLVNFRAQWRVNRTLGFLLEGDALVAPQGRAEDVLLAAQYHLNSRLVFRAGYRVLEGGADNDEVYTFAMFHFVTAGVEYRF